MNINKSGISLKNIPVEILNQKSWSSVLNNVPKLFDILLSNSIKHDMGVAFFTTTWVEQVSKGLGNFFINNGRARWLMSPKLSDFDQVDFQVSI